MFGRIHRALNAAKARFGCRIIHYSIQGNHIHLIIETQNERTLSRAMQGLGVRLAKGLNRVLKRRGQVLEERYFAKSLTSELQVHAALAYLFDNDRKHDAQRGRKLRPAGTLDPYATGVHFRDWREPSDPALLAALRSSRAASEVLRLDAGEKSVVKPRTWLLREGWIAGGPLILAKVRDYSKHPDVREALARAS